MSLQPVQWVIVVFFGVSAHRATYGRLSNEPTYSKDYIQLSRRSDFIEALETAFPDLTAGIHALPLTYKWPSGSAKGTLFRRSADRPHLAWETNKPPAPWRMTQLPTQSTEETIPGNPSFTTAAQADGEYNSLYSDNVGQPYLIAVKLFDDENSLHLRVHIDDPSHDYEWANLSNAPSLVRDLATSTSKNSALAWHLFDKSTDPSIILFDPDNKVNPWGGAGVTAIPKKAAKIDTNKAAPLLDRDSLAESLEYSEEEVEKFEESIEVGNYEVPDKELTAKTRGSAQSAFSKKVKTTMGGAAL